MEKKDFLSKLNKHKILNIKLVEENEDIKMKVVQSGYELKVKTEGKIKGDNRTVKVKIVTRGEDLKIKFVNETEDVKFYLVS